MTDGPGKPPIIDDDSYGSSTSPGMMLFIGVFVAGAASLMTFLLPRDASPTDTLTPGAVRLMASLFLSVGALGLVIAGIAARALRRASAFGKAAAAGSPDAWRLDRDWTPGESSDHARKAAIRAMIKCAGAAVYVALLLFRFPYLFEAERLGSAGDLLFSLMVVAGGAFLWFMYSSPIRKALRQGDSIIRWDGPSPIRIGSDWTGRAEVSARLEAPRARLRYVVEKPVGGDDYGTVRRRELENVPVQASASPRADGGTTVALRFKTEADAPAAAWSRYPSRYWELVLEDEKAAFSTAFPLPLYP